MHNFWLATAAILLILSILILPWAPGGFFLWNFMFLVGTVIGFVAVIQIVFLIVGLIALAAAFV